MDDPMHKVMDAYIANKQLDSSKVRFIFDGFPISRSDASSSHLLCLGEAAPCSPCALKAQGDEHAYACLLKRACVCMSPKASTRNQGSDTGSARHGAGGGELSGDRVIVRIGALALLVFTSPLLVVVCTCQPLSRVSIPPPLPHLESQKSYPGEPATAFLEEEEEEEEEEGAAFAVG